MALPRIWKLRALAAGASTLLALLGAHFVLGALRWRARSVTIEASSEQELGWPKQPRDYVIDSVVGFRPRPSTSLEYEMGALGVPGRELIVRRQNNLGLIRDQDLVGEIPPPRILLLGDSHMMGVVPYQDNAANLLESMLRADGRWPPAIVLDAACGFYSLYQYVLRARTLIGTLRPEVILVVVFLGNDFVELEDEGIPHLTDDGLEVGANPNPPPETASDRMQRLDLEHPIAFWQGMNQAAYLALRPERWPVLERKSDRCLELFQALARESHAELLFALLPSYDMVFGDQLLGRNEFIDLVIRRHFQSDWCARFKELLSKRKISFVDLEPAFRECGRSSLYAKDYHIYKEGHRLLANRVLSSLKQALAGAE